MPKHVLVALPLSDAQRSALQASVPEYEFIFAKTTIWNGSNPTLRDRIPIWCRACCRSSAW